MSRFVLNREAVPTPCVRAGQTPCTLSPSTHQLASLTSPWSERRGVDRGVDRHSALSCRALNAEPAVRVPQNKSLYLGLILSWVTPVLMLQWW